MLSTLGIAAGLGTALAWSFSSIINTALSRGLGVYTFIMWRQPLATAVLAVVCFLAGQFAMYPWQAMAAATLSAFFGLVLCDWCFFSGVLRVGVRPALVCQSLSACCTALFGVVFYNEYLGLQGILGIVVATLGVMMVIIAEKKESQGLSSSPQQQRVGIALSLLSAVLLAAGFILSKESLRWGAPPLMVTFMRNASAGAMVWILALCAGRCRAAVQTLREHRDVWWLLPLGCLIGPTGGIWLSTVALEYLPAAVASTLIGLEPVALLVVSGVIERRCPSPGAICGSFIACGGAALVLLR